METILGYTFDPDVISQIYARQALMNVVSASTSQEILGKRDAETINFQNTNAWIRLASSIDISQDVTTADLPTATLADFKTAAAKYTKYFNVGYGEDMAKRLVLAGGAARYDSANNAVIARNGFLGTDARAYGEGMWEGGAYGLGGNEFGYKPLPYVESMQTQYKNDGALAEAEIKIKCFSPQQLDMIELMYLKPGYTILLEWGHTHYVDNKKQTVSVFDKGVITPAFTKFFTNTDAETLYELIKQERRKRSYNYDGFYGYVTNFSYTFNKDASYDIVVKAITQGAVIESLKLNTAEIDQTAAVVVNGTTPSYPPNALSTLLVNIQTETTAVLPNIIGASTLPITSINGFNSATVAKYVPKPIVTNGSTALDFYAVGFWKGTDANADAGDNTNSYFISFGTLLAILERNHSIYRKNGDPILKFNKGNIMFTVPTHFSSDPRICIIPYTQIYDPLTNGKLGAYDFPNMANVAAELTPAWTNIGPIPNATPNASTFLANMDAIGINFTCVQGIIKETVDSTGKVSITKFLDTLLDRIKASLGGINNFRIRVDENTNTCFISDDATYIALNGSGLAKFATYGIGNGTTGATFLTDVAFQTSITNEFSSQIAIAAQANQNQIGENATAMSQSTLGLIDRTATTKATTKKDEKNSGTQESIAEITRRNVGELYKLLSGIYGNGTTVLQTTGLAQGPIEKAQSFATDYFQWLLGYFSNNAKAITSPFFLPFELNIEMIGLAGMKILQKFAIEDNILPIVYKGKTGFIVFDIKHTFQKNQWRTSLRAYTVPLPDKSLAVWSAPPSLAPPVTLSQAVTGFGAPVGGVGTITGQGLPCITATVLNELAAWGVDVNKVLTGGGNSNYTSGINEKNAKVLPLLNKYASLTGKSPGTAYANGTAWSAIFISWIIYQCDKNFVRSAQHLGYIKAGEISNPANGWKTFTIATEIAAGREIQLQVGDLLWFDVPGVNTHADIIWKIENDWVYLAGGNLGDSAAAYRIKVPGGKLTAGNSNIISPSSKSRSNPNGSLYLKVLKYIGQPIGGFAAANAPAQATFTPLFSTQAQQNQSLQASNFGWAVTNTTTTTPTPAPVSAPKPVATAAKPKVTPPSSNSDWIRNTAKPVSPIQIFPK